ncbi:MAG: hypothetical protein JXB10_01080 [Pirellulales bacterium]|nr:hypothetical protein [Pirellulales bacterium]
MNDTSPLPTDDTQARLRRSIYWLLILIGVGMMLGRIFAVDAVDRRAVEKERLGRLDRDLDRTRRLLVARGVQGEALEQALAQAKSQLQWNAQMRRPFLSANDRSRWCAVRALVEPEMRVPGAPYAIDKVIQEPGWDTIDKVKHDGHLYSSKPPLYPTILAGGYWVLYRVAGLSLATEPYVVDRILLVVFNVLPLTIGFLLIARLVERFGATDWGRIFVVAAAVFGTFLTTFAVVINNHLPGAVCAAALLAATVPVWFDGRRRIGWFLASGFFAALLVSFELPGLALAAAVGAALLWKAPRPTLCGFVPAALVVAAAYFGTNFIAHGTSSIPYMHRGKTDNWYHYTYEVHGEQKTSYWNDKSKMSSVDRGEPDVGVYAFHVLVGHHGIFSLTPVWLLTVMGLAMSFGASRGRPWKELALLILAVSLVCLAFYIFYPNMHRNYGGMTCGFRWVFWLAPLWLVAMIPAVDFLAVRRGGKLLAAVLLMLSVLSASYPIWNPWTHPWLMDFLTYLQ